MQQGEGTQNRLEKTALGQVFHPQNMWNMRQEGEQHWKDELEKTRQLVLLL